MKIKNLNLFFRELIKNKMYSFIKIGGYSLGISACFLIALYLQHELSYDRNVINGDRIYRVVQTQSIDGKIIPSTVLQAPLAETMKNEFPEIENSGRIMFFNAGINRISRSDQVEYFNESGFAYIDQSILDIFQFPTLKGNLKDALSGANKIVITKYAADKFFKNDDPIGKTLILNNNTQNPFTITAVIENFPEKSHMNFNFLMSNNFNDAVNKNWNFSCFHNYVLLKPNTNTKLLEKKLKTIVTKFIIPYDKQQNQFFYDRTNDSYELQSIGDIHLKSAHIFQNASFDFANVGDIKVVWILAISALCILLLASINFINLTIAQASNKAKEIGLKKVIGAKRYSLIGQFVTYSILYSAISIILAIVVSIFSLPYLNELTGKTLTVPWNEWWFIPMLVFTAIFIGSVASIYPSICLTSFNIVKILKRDLSNGNKKYSSKRGLVIFQFAASIVLIVCTLFINKQMNYILNKDLGFSKEQVIVLKGANSLGNNTIPLKNELKSIAGVQSVSVSSFLPIENSMRNGNPYYVLGREGIDPGIIGQNWLVDNSYVETLGLEIIEGRNFSEESGSDLNAAIINQEMAKQLHLDNPIGKRITGGGDSLLVIGLVKNFNYDNMQYSIRPLVMRNGFSNNYINIKVSSSSIPGIIGAITKLWNKLSPDQKIQYSFLDAEYAKMYDNVKRMGILFRSFSILALVVACLGLFGLAEFITKHRTKEIGVRKVNGARVGEVLTLLNKDFIKWVLIAFIIACPIAYYAMNQWLQNFAYKTPMSWWIFALAGILAVLVAVITVSWQSWRAATRNPVEALRYE